MPDSIDRYNYSLSKDLEFICFMLEIDSLCTTCLKELMQSMQVPEKDQTSTRGFKPVQKASRCSSFQVLQEHAQFQ
jgi:hypothetical protein